VSQAEVWLLIADEPEAQKLVVTWPRVNEAVDVMPDQSEYEDALIDQWSALSGVEEQRIRHFVPILFENGILNWEGTQSQQVMDLLRVQVAGQIRRTAR
jgi:hypothetical protein